MICFRYDKAVASAKDKKQPVQDCESFSSNYYATNRAQQEVVAKKKLKGLPAGEGIG